MLMVKKNTETLVAAAKEIGLEVNADETKCILTLLMNIRVMTNKIQIPVQILQ